MTQDEKNKLYNAILELAYEVDRLQQIPLGEVQDKMRIKLDFLINP